MNNKTKKLTEGAAVIAILGVFLLIDRQFVGLFSSYVLFLLPIPMMFFSAKYGFMDSLPVLFGMFVVAFLFSSLATFIYVVGECIIGLAYGSLVYQKRSSKVTLIITMILSVLTEIICIILLAKFFGYDIAKEIDSIQSMTVSIGNYLDNNSNSTSLSNTISLFENLGVFKTIFYITTVLAGVLDAILTHVIGRTVLRRFKIDVPKGDTILTHYPPKWAGYITLIGFVIYFYALKKPFSNELLEMSMQFIGAACMIYLLGYGIVCVYVYLARYVGKTNPILMWILTIVLISFFALFTVLLGFIYITTNIHKKMVTKE